MAADTPLRQMADPTKWHVMPSRPSSRLRRPASASSHAAWSVVSGASGRTQASSRSRRAHSKRKRGVVVMDEDEYEEAMTRIIRRDFFPDNRRMENQLEVRATHRDCLVVFSLLCVFGLFVSLLVPLTVQPCPIGFHSGLMLLPVAILIEWQP